MGPKLQCHIYKNLLLDHILSQLNPVLKFIPYFCFVEIYFNIIIRHIPMLSLLVFR
jgi:hypothetical protein